MAFRMVCATVTYRVILVRSSTTVAPEEFSMGENRINFTRAALDRVTCPPGKGRVYVYDVKRVGLCLQVTRNDARTFYLYRKIDGRPERIRLGTYPPMTPEQARDACDRRNGEIAEGHNPADARRVKRGEMTLAELLTHYIETHAKAHKRTWRDDQETFERYFGKPEDRREPDDGLAPFPGWRTRRIGAVTSEDVQALHVKLGERHGRYAANRVLALLSAMYGNAKLPSPTKGVKRFKEHTRERFLQPDEVPRFFKALDDDPDTLMADFFRACLFTGARRSNVQAMRWADVNFGRRTWTVPAGEMKNDTPMVIHLSEPAMDVLRRRWDERRQGDVYVFASYGKLGHVVEPKGAWARILERAGIDDLRIHDLRRTLGSWQAAAGVSLPIIGKSLGHKTAQATQVYSRLHLAPVAAAVDLAATAIVRAAKPVKRKARAKAKSA
jgi:integrase